MSLGRGRDWGTRGGEKTGIEYGAWFVTWRAGFFLPRTYGPFTTSGTPDLAPPARRERRVKPSSFNFGDWVMGGRGGVRFLIFISLSCTFV